MNSFYYDIALSILTYGLMGYLSYVAMRSRKPNDKGPDDGGIVVDTEPKIDLPPGVVWPSDAPTRIPEKEELLF